MAEKTPVKGKDDKPEKDDGKFHIAPERMDRFTWHLQDLVDAETGEPLGNEEDDSKE
jgi:hypothetical protein